MRWGPMAIQRENSMCSVRSQRQRGKPSCVTSFQVQHGSLADYRVSTFMSKTWKRVLVRRRYALFSSPLAQSHQSLLQLTSKESAKVSASFVLPHQMKRRRRSQKCTSKLSKVNLFMWDWPSAVRHGKSGCASATHPARRVACKD